MKTLNYRYYYLILSSLLLIIPIGCKKDIAKLNTNNAIALSNDLLDPVPGALKGSEDKLTEILKLINVNEQGFVFLARHHNKYLYGKLSKSGYHVDYLHELGYVPTDMAMERDGDGFSFRFQIVGSKNNKGVLYSYIVLTGDVDGIITFPGTTTLNAIIRSSWKRSFYCVGNSVTGAKIYEINDHFTEHHILADSFEISPQNLNVTHIAELKTDSTFLILYDSSDQRVMTKIDIITKEKTRIDLGYTSIIIPAAEDVILKSSAGKILFNSFPKQPSSVPLTDPAFTSYCDPPSGNWMSLGTILGSPDQVNNYKVYDVIKSGDDIYTCGICHFNQTGNVKNLVGYAFISKTSLYRPFTTSVYTFGDSKYLSAFKSIDIVGGYIFAGGFKEMYFTDDNPVTWYGGNKATPFFAKIPLSKL